MSKFNLPVNLEKDTSCEGCPCLSNDEWRCLAEDENIIDAYSEDDPPRPSWCPLVPAP